MKGLTTYKKITSIGIPATYWVICYINFLPLQKIVEVKLNGYMSQKSFENGNKEIEKLSFYCNGNGLPEHVEEFNKFFSEEAFQNFILENKTLIDICYDFIKYKDSDFNECVEKICDNYENCNSKCNII